MTDADGRHEADLAERVAQWKEDDPEPLHDIATLLRRCEL